MARPSSKAGAGPTPVEAEASTPRPAASPALRPRSERTAPSAESGSTPGVAVDPRDARQAPDGVSPGTGSEPPPGAAARAPRPADAAPAVSAPEPPADDGAGEPLAESAPPAETPSTDRAAPARETSPSLLSRATVDATAQVAAQILRRLDGRATRFEMALTPEELGRVDVKLDIDSEGRLTARLAFDNPAAAADLRGRADELRRQLEQAGFHLADDAFEFAERDSGSSAFDRGDDGRRGQGRAFAAATRLASEADVAVVPRWTALTLTPAGVDLKV